MLSLILLTIMGGVALAIVFIGKYIIDTKVIGYKSSIEYLKKLYTEEYKQRHNYERLYKELKERQID